MIFSCVIYHIVVVGVITDVRVGSAHFAHREAVCSWRARRERCTAIVFYCSI